MTEIGNEADCTVSKLHSDFIYYESRLFLREAELKDNDYLLLSYLLRYSLPHRLLPLRISDLL